MRTGPEPREILAIRTAAGITQERAAELCCVTRAAYQHWEYDRRKMPQATWELFLIKTRRRRKK